MSLETNGFYVSPCDGWDDVVGESLKNAFRGTLDLIESAASYINSEIATAYYYVDEGINVLEKAKEPIMPSV